MTFKEYLSRHNIQTRTEGHHHCREGWIQIDCPFCGRNSHKWHMGYHIEAQFFNCWRCGSHNAYETMGSLGIPHQDIRNILQKTSKEKLEQTTHKPTGRFTPPHGIHENLDRAHRTYLKNRDFDWKEIQQRWKVQAIGVAAQLQWRLWIPIHFRGEAVSWTTRSLALHGKGARYITAKPEQEQIHHKDLLYGEDFARHAIIICEGPTDVWRIGPGAVATFGTNATDTQIERMTHYPIRAVCFDQEPEAQAQADKIINCLSLYKGDTFKVEIESGDPATMEDKEIRALRREILSK